MLMNQKASGITMESVGDCSIVINLKEHGVDIKTDGDNLTITIKEKADISQLWHNTSLDNINTTQASIATLEAHATYIDNIKK